MSLWELCKEVVPFVGKTLINQTIGKSGHRLCGSCLIIWLRMLKQDFEHEDLGSVEDVYRKKTCALCCLVYTLCLKYAKDLSTASHDEEIGFNRIQSLLGSSRIVFDADYAPLNECSGSVIVGLDSGSLNLGDIYFVEDANVHPYCIFPLQPAEIKPVKEGNITQAHGGEQVNFEQIKAWVNACESSHGGICNSTGVPIQRQLGFSKLYFIDTEELCLIEADLSVKYLALSYVWGPGQPFTTQTTNIEMLKQKNSLSHLAAEIPIVVRDSMLLARELKIRHLWVDSLCIVQDDSGTKYQLISAMDVIYTNAFFTIINAAGNSCDSPLSGLRGGTRSPFKHVGWANGNFLITEPPALHSALSDSTYSTRAWTYQEQVLSKRCLYFTRHQIYFHCAQKFWEENLKSGPFEKMGSDEDIGNTSRLFVNPMIRHLNRHEIPPGLAPAPETILRTYQQLVRDFTSRKLTMPTDILNAFGGLSAVLETLCGCGNTGSSLFGLLPSMIDQCLLWYPTEPPTRRLIEPKVPSWSWAGWVGGCRYVDYPLSSRSDSYQSINQWAEPENPAHDLGDEDEQALQSEVSIFKFISESQTTSIWRQPMRLTRYLQKSDAAVPGIVTSLPDFLDCGKPLLSFRALSASIDQVQIVVLKAKTTMWPDYTTGIFDSKSGEEIGFLYGFEQLQQNMCPDKELCEQCHYVEVDHWNHQLKGRADKWDHSGFYGEGPHLSPFMHVCLAQETLGPCELIQISSRIGSSFNFRFGENTAMVMLLRWDGEVAERITIGEVNRDAWSRLFKTERDILLS